MNKTAIVTGAGSGVGQAIALALAKQGWRVAILGRRREMLDETVRIAGANAENLTPFDCDVGKADAVATVAEKILDRFGSVEVLVNAAGTNAPKRALNVLSLEDYHAMMDANLHGAYYCVQAFLPAMRTNRSGTIINIVSEAGKQASPKAGPAYVMSKFGLAGLTQSINAEERGNGIRACSVFPGDVDTPLLDKRPNPPPAEARARMLRSEDVAECALLAILLPARALVEEIVIRPR
jgi:NAD(P)-dependent dehydrogenase (short-subunit alcohol dehydrogenase family)